ncbi:ArgE/DapE family deacylase [Limosilactobacillus sp. STM2_1]|uniref:Probable succinyl-diaminopimelate desuccinylase n=1 Tax=Limosilactobacillus rudii TaxID=2759755 RepID=A0A7W3UMX7_9LACO|nr:ArgE/DapE family deacylase [Limosilactobacillus rudii]MBB1079304.1 ArgE/DapE family deacylase [Limosilactobacillus rudii]MBB1098502.1 ArgE/DapE family deacylase [Limosilactobacillus rudii]MCD7135510.1 ArgE/DapE family deacylase [Limosilactobacillus rudii]
MEANEKVKVLQDLIQIHTVNGNEAEVAHYLQKLLSIHGIEAKVDEFGDRRANLIAEIGTGENSRVLGFTGHQDTVAVPNPDRWQHSPFESEIVGDRIYGRGAADMKSGLAAQALSLIELKEANQLPTGKVRFIATAGEELGTPGAYRLEKQGTATDLTALVVGEPTGGNVIFAHSGSMNYRITSFGKSCHSSHPDQGVNAIEGLLKFVEEEKHLFDDAKDDQYLGKVQHSITVFNGGDQVNTIPDSATLHGNIRPTATFNNKKVIDRLQDTIEYINHTTPFQLELKIIQDFYPIATDPTDQFVQTALNAAQRNYPNDVKLDIINGATDASVFTLHRPDLPVVVLGCDSWNAAHQTDEFTTISSYLATIKAYKQIVRNYFA